MKTPEESDVGIICYISELPGFRGILKQRYSDFIVNEVDLDGNVVHLTSLDAPPELAEEKEKTSDKPNKGYASECELFRSLAGDSDAERLIAFISQINSGPEDDISPIVLSPNSDKSQRTAIHNFFKANFKFLVTDTVDGTDASSKCIRVRLNSSSNNKGRISNKRKERGDKPFDSRGSKSWPEHVGKFLRFHLYKENKDTQEALGVIGKMLGIQTRSFGFAGTKDKRAVSTQRVTVFKQQASRVAALNKRLIGIKVGDFCHVNESLVLGQLQGNHFTITLRGIVADSENTVKASADALGKHGFINYFGLQRFGSGSVPTYLVGAALLRGEWQTVVNMILDPREGERDTFKNARQYYKDTGDIEGSLRQLPRFFVAERAILQCLKKYPENHLQAVKAIPRTLRMMYVHSYQSYLWNHAASMRVQRYGTNQIVLGDLVYSKRDSTQKVAATADSECEDENGDGMGDCDSLDEICGDDVPEEKIDYVKAVTAEDIETGNYTIDDVILPMPGSRVIYPTNNITEVYHDLAKKDGISLTEGLHNVKEFSITSMTGSYRRVFQKPKEFDWELVTYTDGNIPLAETDLDHITKSKHVKLVKDDNPESGNQDKDSPKSENQDKALPNRVSKESELSNNDQAQDEKVVQKVESLRGAHDAQIALKLSFTLPASSYATMAIRELLKTSTSVAFHKALN